MKTIAERIKEITKSNKLTSEQFAERILCNKRTIQRYENGVSLPDAYNLKRMSMEFGVSVDYILGLTDNMEVSYQAEEIGLLYKKYKQMMYNPILKDEEYYWIRIEITEEKEYIRSMQTEWVGFIEENGMRKEIRKPRAVIPENAIEICKKLRGTPVIINKVSEIGIFYLFGGEAIISESLCKKHLPEILEPIVVN